MFWQELGRSLKEQFFAPGKMLVYVRALINILIIIVGAWGITRGFKWLISRIHRRKEERYVRTIVPLVHSLARYFILIIAVILILRAVGVDYKAILAGAGVAGLAIGFGAQTLIKDFISGFFILFEGLLAVGDYISTGQIEGTVEKIGLRVTQLRAFDGTLWTIPNGELTRFGNKNRDYMRVLVSFDIAYEQNADNVLAVVAQASEKWYQENQSLCLEKPEVQGLLSFGDSGLGVRVVCKVRAGEQWEAERKLRLQLKQAFDAAGVEIPFPRRVVYHR
jgi:small conductance mechanosensitive channel|uniref:Mechanosensitive ion channel family protein n=1 Tax=candidate division WOR-3 bacterium TaxID=2052148 RepID=A0A7V3PV27_UNCW3